MDILLSLLFIIVVYLVPVLWGKYGKIAWVNYLAERGIIPSSRRQEMPGSREVTIQNEEATTYAVNEVQLESPAVASLEISAPSEVKEERTPWRNKMDVNAVINGVIFAEIVQPPRAYRPFVTRK